MIPEVATGQKGIMQNIIKNLKESMVLGRKILLILSILLFISGCDKKEEVTLDITKEEESTESIWDSSSSKADYEEYSKEICVHICGEVMSPGVYYLSGNARVCDAIKIAGGTTQSADPEFMNQARTLEDGEQIVIPSVEEAVDLEKSKEADLSESRNGTEKDSGKININSASQEQLDSLPGIGEAKAKMILSYREENGSFSQIEDIMNIEGIKEGVYNKIKEYITVD